MIFEDSSHHFSTYQHSIDSPDLQPISLPMSGHDKTLEGMLNLSNAGFSFPGSDAFAQYPQPSYYSQLPSQYELPNSYQEAEQDEYSDGDCYDPSAFDIKAVAPINVNSQTSHPVQTKESQPASRKRKASPYVEYAQPQPQKKTMISHVHVRDSESDQYEFNQPSPYSPYGSVPVPHTTNNSPRPSHHYSTSIASQASVAAPSPHTPAFSPSHTSTVKTEQSPRAPVTPLPRPASTSNPYNASIPRLVRTSTIPQQGSPNLSSGIAAGLHTHTFNPYAMYPQHKASLRLSGDLDGVALDWSEEEMQARRKLVVFTREQNGSIIDAEFKIVPQDEWQRNTITVNCIWWKERKEAYVTSVDTIALLEQLVAVRFTVEEKNRIRRNLEGFRPLTVSKAKADSEDFFKTIMGFANPKPRNIEKDVKVFPWKILAHALKKIISKYSASYSSTASTLATPAPSVYASTENSTEYQLAPSPSHEVLPHSMVPVSMPATPYNSHMMSGRMPISVPSSAPELSLQVPSTPQSYEFQPYSYETMPMASYPMHMPQHAMTAPIQRPQPNWVYDQCTAPELVAHMQPASAPVSAYPRGHNEFVEYYGPQPYQQYYHH